MSRRRSGRRTAAPPAARPVGSPAPRRPDDGVDPSESISARLRSATVPAAGLLPIRFFFGATFLYAGLDKILDPTFFDATSATSIQAQMEGFARGSPIGALVRLAQPEAAAIGLIIAIAEIAIGLGALTGLAFRIAAAGGAVLSLVFFLTVSWTTHPFYLGSDLPYAVGWLTLALVGHGGLLVPRSVLTPAAGPTRTGTRGPRDGAVPSPERRALLQAGLLAVAAVAVASMAVPMRILGLERAAESESAGATATPGSTSPGVTPSGRPATGLDIASVADVDRVGSAVFTVPFDAPAPLPAGDPGVIVRLKDGSYAAFDAVCTHAGCTVAWSSTDGALVCPCHGAAFDPEHGAAVLAGPTDQPLAVLPIVVDASTGTILLKT